MERLIEHLRHQEPTNMKEILDVMGVFIITLNIGFAIITAEHINIVVGALGLASTIIRNLPLVFVRMWEVWLFITRLFERFDDVQCVEYFDDARNRIAFFSLVKT